MSVKSRRIIALLLCLVMVFSSMPMTAWGMDVESAGQVVELDAPSTEVSPEDITADIDDETTTEDNPTAAENDPAVEAEPATEDEPVVEEDITAEDEPVVEENVTTEDEPVVEENVTTEDEPVVEEDTATEEEPVVEGESATEGEPVVEEEPVIEEIPAVEEEIPVLGGVITEQYGIMLLNEVMLLSEEVASVTVNLTAQANGEFLLAPQIGVEITGDVAESYGYEDQVADGVSLLDALVWAHTQYTEDFSAETAAEYLIVDDNYISKVWGETESRIGFLVNGVQPHDDNLSTGGYYGVYGIGQAEVEDEDDIEFFLYQDEAYGDDYVWLEIDGSKADGAVLTAGDSVDVYVKGYSPFEYGCQTEDAIEENTKAISDVALYLVDGEDGALTSLNVKTDKDGKASVSIPYDWAGSYYLTAKSMNMIMGLAEVTVNEFVDNGASALTALEVAVGGNTVDAATVQTLSPAFDKETLEYSTPILDYQSDKNQRFVWVKVNADENATVTAKCGDSEVATVTSGEWTVLQVEGGYWFAPTYSGALSTGAYNDVVITVSADGARDKTYTVTIPMQPDIANQSLAWKTDLADAVYYTKDAENAALTVEAEYKNRPLENEDVITYQWYSKESADAEGGTAIAGATAAAYSPATAELGTGYYYVVASCGELESITSNVVAVTVADEAAPKSVSIVCDHKYTIPDSGVMALGGVDYVAKVGETLQLKAVDENGKETPVEWITNTMYGGTLDKETGVYTITGTSYSYIQVASLYDPSIKSEEKAIVVKDYSINQYYKTNSVTLATDGQSFKMIDTQSGISNNYVIWSYTSSAENIAELTSDLATKPARIEFTALRPGTITASFDLDLDGDGKADGNGMTDTATLTINGIAVEDAAGKLTKTYLEMSSEATSAPTVQLKALSSTENAEFTWSSADETVATVDEDGLVTAKGVGSVIISATDGTYTGGIKVVVTSAETPYFEQIDFATTTAWNNGLSNVTWKTANFKPSTLEYTGLQLTKATVSTLTLNANTLYNTDKYSAVATYTDANGEAKSVDIKSGTATELKDIPLETSIVTITLADKTDAVKKSVYTFEVTRPRDTGKAIAYNGIVFTPEGRDLWKDKYDEKTEGIMYVANADGSFAQYQGVNSSRLYYRTYAMNALESFTLTVKGSSAYTHIRYSADDGATWMYLGQTGTGGVKTNGITFPAAVGEDNPVVEVMIQILDDATYAANVKAEKDGFADAAPNTYTVWVEQIPELSAACDILTAEVSDGDWYPAFDVNRTDYRLVVDTGAAAPVLTYTISEGAVATIGGQKQQPDENGKYTLALTNASQNIVIAAGDGMSSKTYSFGYNEKESDRVPDKVVDFLSVNSQYTNGGYGTYPQKTLTGGDVLSLGNFGGYVTYYYKSPLTNDPANQYGIDFYVDGNAFKDTSTGVGLGSMEPGQVWVSEDGEEWYALAGSEHYEDGTLWDYAVTYSKTETGGTAWVDNQGNTHESTHGRSFAWPRPDIYTMNDLAAQESFTLSGILIPCVDGTVTGTDKFNSFSSGGRFGYVDVMVNGRANPYLANDKYGNESTGFDLAWAVDEAGMPVDVSGKEFHYVKVVTASNIMAGSANEKSTEVGAVIRAESLDEAVGVTDAPAGVTISGNGEDKEVKFTGGKQVYAVDLGEMKYVSIKVDGAAADDNIYINNQRVASGEAADGFKVTAADGEKPVRIIVQNGDKEPLIYMLKLTSDASENDELIEGIKVDIYGVDRVAETKDGETYTLSVGHRIDEVGIEPVTSAGVALTVNGEAVADVYDLKTGANSFTIAAQKGDVTQTVTLTITKDSAPVATSTIKVSFRLLGDEKHGDPTGESDTHTLKDNNLQQWIKKTTYTVDDTATVLDVLIMALDDAGIDYVNEGGNYVSEINGLGEFDNGPYSGWMYTLNGKHSEYGVMEQGLDNGDVIVFHYSDDYTVEEGSEGYEPYNPSSGGGAVITAEDRAAAKDVSELIAAIGTVDEDSKEAITEARAAYDKLTAAQKDLVSSYDELVAAEKAYAELTGEDIAPVEIPYTDIAGHWAAEAIKFAYDKGLMTGESETVFAPELATSRAMIATILYRLEGSPAVSGEASFADVADGAWYADAIRWAEANSIVSGYVNGNFGPNDSITREQLASILYRYAAYKGLNINGSADLSRFTDAAGIAEWSRIALEWANAEGLINGKQDNTIDAKGKATRAEVATILMRYIQKTAE